MSKVFTSESVTEGHPDKLCDRISDSILDELLSVDKGSRVAVECFATAGLIHVAGEVSSKADVDFESVVRDTVKNVGYVSKDTCFDGDTCGIIVGINPQSPDIAAKVNCAVEAKDSSVDRFNLLGAGDQGIMFGYASNETKDLMPLPISLSHALAYRLSLARKCGFIDGLLPDGKTQVSVEYNSFGRPVKVRDVIVSSQHLDSVSDLDDAIFEYVFKPVADSDVFGRVDFSEACLLVNPGGRFVLGGPAADTGLTGRKIIVDTYGGSAAHGGGAFSGKDPSKVDRSGAYMARFVAKNVVAAGLADRCEVQFSYGIGIANALSVFVNTFETGDDDKVLRFVRENFDLRPGAIIECLDLLNVKYAPLTAYGHFGETVPGVVKPWEKVVV